MKISHFHVSEPTSRGRFGVLAGRIERLRGVMGVVAVRSMGLMTVLYDERRIDPVAISDAVLLAMAEPADDPEAGDTVAPDAGSPIEPALEPGTVMVLEPSDREPTEPCREPTARPARRPPKRGRAWARRAMTGV